MKKVISKFVMSVFLLVIIIGVAGCGKTSIESILMDNHKWNESREQFDKKNSKFNSTIFGLETKEKPFYYYDEGKLVLIGYRLKGNVDDYYRIYNSFTEELGEPSETNDGYAFNNIWKDYDENCYQLLLQDNGSGGIDYIYVGISRNANTE